MQPKRLNVNLSVSEQIAPQSIAGIAGAGFRSVICDRPDGEGTEQPCFLPPFYFQAMLRDREWMTTPQTAG